MTNGTCSIRSWRTLRVASRCRSSGSFSTRRPARRARSQLAFAYERLTQDPKLKFLPSALQSEILMHAATFARSSPIWGATGYPEQASR
jgi:hypothetical protein